MLTATCIVLCTSVLAGAGAIIKTRREYPWTGVLISTVIVLGVLCLISYFLYRAVYARPLCPGCRKVMIEEGTLEIGKADWRLFKCDSCQQRCRVPGLTRGAE
jgi:hypothetical protein